MTRREGEPSDAILVLAGGTEPDGRLTPESAARLEAAVALYRRGAAPVLICSGGWSFLNAERPTQTEAALLRAAARRRGVPARAILTEESSQDTLGNFYFVKRRLLEPRGWTRLVVVTSDFHLLRTRYVCRKILGARYSIRYVTAPSGLTGATARKMLRREELSARLTRSLLDGVLDGDDAEVGYALVTRHPAYAPHARLGRAIVRLLVRP